MPIKPELNVSGYRGIWGETLTEEIIKNYVLAFAFFIKEESKKGQTTILIGRDGRESGLEIKKIIIEELKKIGVRVIDGNIMPTPTVLFSVRKHKYDGAIIITASHNPIEYNGLKFVNNKALFTIKEEVEKIKKYYTGEPNKLFLSAQKFSSENFLCSSWVCFWQTTLLLRLLKTVLLGSPNFIKEHADQILANINVKAIRAKKFKVVVDMINASASVMDPYLFEKLGVNIIPLNDIPNGKFTHKPEPIIENLGDIAKKVLESRADLGFAHDPDADRLVIINEKGEVISEEYSIATAVENILSKNPGKNIVINLSTSQMCVDIAEKYGSKCFRTKIGEGYVVEEILEHQAIIGGEGNGGVIYPKINTARDSFTALSLILEILAERKQTISECINTLPKYFMKKDKWSIVGKDLNEMFLKLKSNFKEAKTDEQDGIRLDFPNNSWIHLRSSNTEPIIRMFGEAKTEKQINNLFEKIKNILM